MTINANNSMFRYDDRSVTERRQPSQEARDRVRQAFDADKLIDICTRQDFSAYADYHALVPDRWADERFYWHKDNGSNILFVAHLDHVQDDATCQVTNTAAGLLATSGALDDRLGAYVGLELLPALGMKFDVLLTTDEECAASTARDFRTDKQYNWMIEFDRGGTDVVMYQYESSVVENLIKEAGARVGIGSYSDIADLDDLGCIGMNWGVGYQDYHSARSHAWLEDTFFMVARFEKFHAANADKHFVYDYRKSSWLDDDGDDSYFITADCGDVIDVEDEESWVELADREVVCRLCYEALNAP